MTATTTEMTTAPSRTPLLAALGLAVGAILTAVGTFWDLTDNETGTSHDIGEYLFCVGIAAVGAALFFGTMVRTARAGHPARRAVILSVIGFLSLAVFWTGLPAVLVAASVACALIERDKLGSLGAASKTALAIDVVVFGLAVWLAIAG